MHTERCPGALFVRSCGMGTVCSICGVDTAGSDEDSAWI